MRKFATKHPVIAFCVLNVFILLPIIGGLNLWLFPASFDYTLMFPQWAPAIAAIIVVWLRNSKTGINELFKKASAKRSSLKWGLMAVIIPTIFTFATYIVLIYAEYGQWIMPTLPRSVGNYALCFIATLFGSYGEEIGWRGFMLPQLNKKYSLFISSLIVGMFWGVWHMRFQLGLPAFGLYILGVTCFSVLISWLCSKTKGNMFVAIIFHTTINMCFLFLFENILSDISQQQTGVQINNTHLYAMLYGIIAIVFAIPCIFVVKNMLGKRNTHQIE